MIVFNNVKLPINASVEEAFSVAVARLRKLGITDRDITFSVFRRSVDARRRDNIFFVYSIAANGGFRIPSADKLAAVDAVEWRKAYPTPVIGDVPMDAPPVIVGSGPAGMFAALILAEHGYRPTVLERGASVAERTEALARFISTHRLDPETNVQFGAGGAGTFSDGKLVTRINDPLSNYVIDRLIEFGAPAEVGYVAKPHVGTDVLSTVVENILARIEALGGRVEYRTKFIRPDARFGRVVAAVTDRGSIPAGAIILAIGHSARDTYGQLLELGMNIEAKPFSVGMRIEHLAEDIDRALYGSFAGNPVLGHAEYNLSHNTKQRGVYTFCMCPGGVVVPAASEEGGVVVNGMSYHSRNGRNSNSAVVCSVFREDYGATPASAIDFQRRIERSAFVAGGGDYTAPIATVGDFISGGCGSEPCRIMPTYMNGSNVKLADPGEVFPEFITKALKDALVAFDGRISGFAAKDAVLTCAETRTSAPVRIMRDSVSGLATGYDNLYPSGEGAGYAGGITSAAIDGVRCAMALMQKYKPTQRG